jgi:hypothetical protein
MICPECRLWMSGQQACCMAAPDLHCCTAAAVFLYSLATFWAGALTAVFPDWVVDAEAVSLQWLL